jgi:hypothetical protein
MTPYALLLPALLSAFGSLSARAGEYYTDGSFSPSVVLGITNRVTARTGEIVVSRDAPSYYDDLRISLRRCWTAPRTQAPDDAALVEIVRLPPQPDAAEEAATTDAPPPGTEKGEPIFVGWMFASSPALSAPEHPIYSLRVLKCGDGKKEETPAADDPASPPAPEGKTEP